MLGMLFLLVSVGSEIGFQISRDGANFIFNVNGFWVVAFLALLLVWHALSARIGRGDRH